MKNCSFQINYQMLRVNWQDSKVYNIIQKFTIEILIQGLRKVFEFSENISQERIKWTKKITNVRYILNVRHVHINCAYKLCIF